MRILHVIPHFAPAWAYGGTVRVAADVTRRLAARGHHVEVFTTDTLDASRRIRASHRSANQSGPRVRHFSNVSNTLAWRLHASSPPALLPVAWREVAHFDVVHLHEFRTIENAIVGHFAHHTGVPYIVSAHNSVQRVMGKTVPKLLFDIVVGRRLTECAAGLHAVSNDERRQYLSYGVAPHKIRIIPNGVDVAEFVDLPKRTLFRERLGIPASKKVVLFLSRLHRVKGVDLLIDAFAQMGRHDIVLVLAGPDDGFRTEAERQCHGLGLDDRVYFPGTLTGREKLAALSACDLLVQPSRTEGRSMSMLDACAAGVPVVYTEGCNFPEIAAAGAGIEVPFRTASLAAAVLQVLDQGRCEMGERGRAFVMQAYSLDACVDRLEAWYTEIKTRRKTSSEA